LSIYFQRTTRCCIPGYGTLHNLCPLTLLSNPKVRIIFFLGASTLCDRETLAALPSCYFLLNLPRVAILLVVCCEWSHVTPVAFVFIAFPWVLASPLTNRYSNEVSKRHIFLFLPSVFCPITFSLMSHHDSVRRPSLRYETLAYRSTEYICSALLY
jgi:hypothetical protein